VNSGGRTTVPVRLCPTYMQTVTNSAVTINTLTRCWWVLCSSHRLRLKTRHAVAVLYRYQSNAVQSQYCTTTVVSLQEQLWPSQ